jgi:hypothetical protein
VNLVKGEAQVFSAPQSSFDPVQLSRVIKDAGFTATKVVFSANGTLVRREQILELHVPGLEYSLVLSGGSRIERLTEQSDLVGRDIHMRGKLHPGSRDHPPGMTVENFQPVP